MSVGFHYGRVRFSKYQREEQIGMLDVELKSAYVDNVVYIVVTKIKENCRATPN